MLCPERESIDLALSLCACVHFIAPQCCMSCVSWQHCSGSRVGQWAPYSAHTHSLPELSEHLSAEQYSKLCHLATALIHSFTHVALCEAIKLIKAITVMILWERMGERCTDCQCTIHCPALSPVQLCLHTRPHLSALCAVPQDICPPNIVGRHSER